MRWGGPPGGAQFLVEITAWLLPGAQHDGVDLQDPALAVHGDVQPGVVDAVVADAGDHGDPAVLEFGAVDPAGGPAQTGADLGRLALEEVDRARRGGPLGCGEAAGSAVVRVDAPPTEVRGRVLAGPVAAVGEVRGDVEADAARPEDGHPVTDGGVVPKDVQVAEDTGVFDAGEFRGSWGDTGGDHDLVVLREAVRAHPCPQLHVHAVQLELGAEVAEGFVELESNIISPSGIRLEKHQPPRGGHP